MGNDSIEKLTMPKWGLSMTHGKVVQWLVEEGASVSPGAEMVEVEIPLPAEPEIIEFNYQHGVLAHLR